MATYDITALSSPLEFDTTNGRYTDMQDIPGTNWVAVSWARSTTVINVQVFNCDPTTGAMTAIGSPVDVEAGTGTINATSLVFINSTNLAVFWTGSGNDGFCRLLSMDGSGNLATNGSALEFDTNAAISISAILWDSTHILVAYRGGPLSTLNATVIVSFDTGAGTMALVGSPLAFNGSAIDFPKVIKINSTKAIIFYKQDSDGDGKARVVDVNAGTFAVTTAGAIHTWSAGNVESNWCMLINNAGNPIIVANIWGINGSTYIAQTFNVNTSTWAVTDFGSEEPLGGTGVFAGIIFGIDSDTIISFYERAAATGDGNATTLDYDSGTGELTPIATLANFYTDGFVDVSGVHKGNGRCVLAWAGSASDGFIQAFQVEMPVASNIKTYNTNARANIKTINTNPIANVKTLDTNVNA